MLLLRPASVAISVLPIAAVTTPEVLLSIVLAWPTVAVPLVTLAATVADLLIPLALSAVAISDA